MALSRRILEGGEEAAADYVTGSVERDGLYQAFETLGLLSSGEN